jgi:hypothetical protein
MEQLTLLPLKSNDGSTKEGTVCNCDGQSYLGVSVQAGDITSVLTPYLRADRRKSHFSCGTLMTTASKPFHKVITLAPLVSWKDKYSVAQCAEEYLYSLKNHECHEKDGHSMTFHSKYLKAGTAVRIKLQLSQRERYPVTEKHQCTTIGPGAVVSNVYVVDLEEEAAKSRRPSEIRRMLDL